MTDSKDRPAAVDLFCGVGGLSYGMQQAGVRIDAGIDIDPACQHPFEKNVGSLFHERDISGLDAAFVNSLFSGAPARILAGCAPCQPFSSYTGKRASRADEWELLSSFGRIAAELLPDVVTMENVPGLERRPVFGEFLSVLGEAGYQYSYSVVHCAEYGVPQARRRLVLLASRHGSIAMVPATHDRQRYVTARDIIGRCEDIGAGDTSVSDPLHKASGLSELNLERIRRSKPGGTWRDWDEDLRAECHVRASGRSFPSVYGRMRWDEPAPTITTQFHGYGSGRFGHPKQDRAISLREGALLQTFPEDYSFVPDGSAIPIAPLARLIGNAVPPRLGEAIGRSIVAHLAGVPGFSGCFLGGLAPSAAQ